MIHIFSSTGSAYDSCMCDEAINDGDTLLIESERVVGLAFTWPIAVTTECGALHTVKDGTTIESLGEFTQAQIDAARKLARELGYE